MARTTCIVVGTGGFARWHIRTMLEQRRTTDIVGLVEPGSASRVATASLFAERGLACPPFYDTIRKLIRAVGPADAALVCTPHKFHLENTRDCLKNGMDVLLEKPMVMNTSEARRLIRLRDQTGGLVVVAFPGSLSPAVHKAKALIRKGVLGKVTSISAYVHQRWKAATAGTWRQDPEISGGGFLFDTGSHMVNTIVDLLDEDVVKVSALLDRCGTPVEINSAVNAVSRGGVTISMAGAGDSIQCVSQVHVFGDEAVLRTGIWGEELALRSRDNSGYKPIPYPRSKGPWEQFLKVRRGRLPNPCPPEVGLRFARLMDMIRKSAETGETVKTRVTAST
jgi:predicted dehydrogenase